MKITIQRDMSSKASDTTMSNTATSSQDEEQQRIALLETVALPYEIGGSLQGYLQNTMDQDWYKLNTTNAGIYQFDIPTPANNVPNVQLYELVEDKDEKGKPYKSLSLRFI